MSKIRWCFQSTIAEFMRMDINTWLREMEDNFALVYEGYPLGEKQIEAWKDCFPVMQRALAGTETIDTSYIVFEYKLPYEGGRRPDVLLINANCVLVLEFKMYENIAQAAIDQVLAYVRDIQEYHVASRNMKVVPILVLTGAKGLHKELDNLHICSEDKLKFNIIQSEKFDIDAWLYSAYEPLPTVVEAARRFARHEELPQIRQVQSTGIGDAINCLNKIKEDAFANTKHVLALVTGVPGAGKTFLGLKFVYDQEQVKSIYLSGNGPLIKVLENALHSKTFVKGIHKVLDEYCSLGAKDFKENIVVFDEGQRAWDDKQMQSKKHRSGSEPELIIRMMNERLDWCVLLVLVGEGQEINTGEHAGIQQWATAIDSSWEVVCPEN